MTSAFFKRVLCLISGLTVILLSLGIDGRAQDQTLNLNSNLSEAEFQAMLGRLSDEQVRDILIAEFAARRVDETVAPEGLLTRTRDAVEALTTNAAALIAQWPHLGSAFGAVHRHLADAGGVGLALLALLVCLAAGFVVRHFWRRGAVRRQVALAERNAGLGAYGTISTIGDAALFLLIELSSSVAFALTAMAALYLLFHNADLRLFVSGYVAMATVVLVVQSFVDFMFPRNWPVYRLVAINDRATRLVHIVVIGLSALWMFETVTSDLMAKFGAPGGTPDLFSLVLGLVWISSTLVGIFLINRATTDLLPPKTESGLGALLSRNWALLMGIAQVIIWILFTGGALIIGDVDAIAGTIFLNLLVFIGFWMAHRILIHYLRAQDMDEAIKAAIGRAALALLVAAGLIIILSTWGLDPSTLAAGGTAERAVQAVINVVLTAFVGWAIWDFIRTFIDIRTAAEQPEDATETGSDTEGGTGASRTATLLPLLRSVALAAIGLTCLFTALSSLGVNVAPLVAGAGVIGLAIGFGAQTLVKDIVSGVFFLIDDAFRLGEFIDAGSTVGTVEKISIRSLQLRHPLGPVHIIPYGEISKITNNSRDWVIVKLKFIVPFNTDLNRVRKIFKKIGQQMYEENPFYADNIIEPFKFQGVRDVDDVGITVRGKFMTKPGTQFLIQKDIYNRVQNAFDENGIEFARREVRVKIPDSVELSEQQKTTLATAAAEAASNAPATGQG